jgi:hypothetical protein
MYEHLNQTQLYQVGQIYSAIAMCTPTEGRDFVVDIDFPGDGIQPTIRVDGISAMGQAWVPHLMAALTQLYGVRPNDTETQQEKQQ